MAINQIKNLLTHNLNDINNINILSVSHLSDERIEMVRAMHKHDDRLELLFIESGFGEHIINGKTYATSAGDVLIYNCGVLHEEFAVRQTGFSVIGLAVNGVKFDNLPVNWLTEKHHIPIIKTGHHFLEIQSLFKMIHNEALIKNKHNSIIAHSLLIATLLKLKRLDQKSAIYHDSKDYQLALTVKDYIDLNYQKQITLEEIGKNLHISPFYLSHIFKDLTGYSPKQYIIRRRIGEIQSLLLHTDLPVAIIAEQVGYLNINNFYKTFRRLVGLSPIEYRHTMQKD